jgi:hypothetical protein
VGGGCHEWCISPPPLAASEVTEDTAVEAGNRLVLAHSTLGGKGGGG